MKVLLADDSAMVRRSLMAMLAKIKTITDIREAGDGLEAIEFLGREQFDLIILDIKMPGKGGMDVLDYIGERKIDSTVVMLTNYAIAPYRKKCIELGADYFLDKSLEFRKLLEIVCKVSGAADRPVS